MSKNEIVNENAPMLPALLKDLVIAMVIAGAVLYFIRPTIVKQTSMQSTMNPNDYLIMYRQAYRSKAPERGDIIIFKSDLPDEEGKDKLLIKRVIGLPGDEIQIKNQKVKIFLHAAFQSRLSIIFYLNLETGQFQIILFQFSNWQFILHN